MEESTSTSASGVTSPADSGGRVETSLRTDRNRLQRDRTLQAADQHIGAESAADRRFSGRATIPPGKDATTACRRSVYCPGNRSALGEADIEPDARDATRIGLVPAMYRLEVAVHLLLRAEHKTHAGRYVACEHASTHLRRSRRRRKGRKREACACHQCLPDHLESPAKTARAPDL